MFRNDNSQLITNSNLILRGTLYYNYTAESPESYKSNYFVLITFSIADRDLGMY